MAKLRIALGQMSSGHRLQENLTVMKELVAEASRAKAAVVILPEMAYFQGPPEEARALAPRYGEILEVFCGWAREYALTLLPGSLREPSPDPKLFHNTLPVISPSGEILAVYRKLFLFQARLPHRTYDESERCRAGSEIVICRSAPVPLGLSICFDLRFPELYRSLKKRGAELMVVPSSFTAITGRAHWEALLRARAIENQCFVAAPAQAGRVGDGSDTHGHSMVVSPWGEILLNLGTTTGLGLCEIDTAEIGHCGQKVNAWASRREEIFPIA